MNGTHQILIVDDEPRNLRLLEALLKTDGYEVQKASTGEEALRKVQEKNPDLILLDVMMPGEDGFGICRKLRSEKPFRLTPIVMVTALNSTEDKVQGLKAGADDFLSKPVNKDELLAKVQSLLRIHVLQLELERSRKELAAKNRNLEELACYKEQLTQMLVHDLRNPLCGITGNLDLMKMLLDGNNHREKTNLLLNRAKESTQQLSRLVADILDIARLRENQLVPNFSKVVLEDLFRETANAFRTLADLEQIRIVCEPVGDLPPVPADPDLLGRVLANLVNNALKFTPVGGEIRLQARLEAPDVQIRISDSGEGIPEGQREWIFERFWKAPAPGQSPRKGYGLGLAFCRLAVEAHGGRIRVEPAEIGGSVFIINLPGGQPEESGK